MVEVVCGIGSGYVWDDSGANRMMDAAGAEEGGQNT